MKRSFVFGPAYAAIALVFCLTLAARAADLASDVAPYVGEQTIAVGHIDLTRLEVGTIVEHLGTVMPEWVPDREDYLSRIRENLEAARKLGAEQLYVLVSLDDLPERPPVVLLPVSSKADEKGLRELLGSQFGLTVDKVGSSLAVGHPKSLEKLRSQKAVARPELAAAFAGAGDSVAKLFVVPTELHRRIVEEIMPRLPNEVGGVPSTVLTHGLRWAAIGMDIMPQAELRLVVQSDSEQAAKALRDLWATCMNLPALEQAAQGPVPNWSKLRPLLIPEVKGDRLVIDLKADDPAAPFVAGLGPLSQKLWASKLARESVSKLRQFGLVMHNYHDVHKHFPLPAVKGRGGKPLLSWRVHLLPYLEEQKLYQEFRLDEPWDSEHNSKLISKMPAIYRSPLQSSKEDRETPYVLPVGNGAIFDPNKPATVATITDGTSKTVMVVEVAPEHAVVWTKPDDLQFNPKEPLKGIGKPYPDLFCTVFADGATHLIPLATPTKTLRLLFTAADGEIVAIP